MTSVTAKSVTLSLFVAVQALPTWSPVVEAFKVVCLTIITMLVGWIARSVFMNRDDTRMIKQRLFGANGENGLTSEVKKLMEEVRVLNGWKAAIEAVEEAERDQYPGPDRRKHSRRLRDHINEQHAHHTTDEFPLP